MASTVQIHNLDLFQRHHANMATSLTHRLEIARAANNTQLIALLEREKQQIELETLQIAKKSPIDYLKKLWSQMRQAIAHAGNLQVWTTSDDAGTIWWNAYNPRTGKSVSTDSETEMRLWIEANYWEN